MKRKRIKKEYHQKIFADKKQFQSYIRFLELFDPIYSGNYDANFVKNEIGREKNNNDGFGGNMWSRPSVQAAWT